VRFCAVLNGAPQERCETIPACASCLPETSRRAPVANAREDSPVSDALRSIPEKRDAFLSPSRFSTYETYLYAPPGGRVQSQESMRRKNLNPPERIQREKVGVARDNVRRVPAHGNFQKLIVLRIAANPNSHIHLNPFRLARQSRQKVSNIFLIYVSMEFFPAEDFVELGERCKREQDSSFLEGHFECMSRL